MAGLRLAARLVDGAFGELPLLKLDVLFGEIRGRIFFRELGLPARLGCVSTAGKSPTLGVTLLARTLQRHVGIAAQADANLTTAQNLAKPPKSRFKSLDRNEQGSLVHGLFILRSALSAVHRMFDSVIVEQGRHGYAIRSF